MKVTTVKKCFRSLIIRTKIRYYPSAYKISKD